MGEANPGKEAPGGEAQSSARAAGREEQVLSGIGVAPGIAIGPACLYAADAPEVQARSLEEGTVEQEVERFEEAVERAEHELETVISVTRQRLGEDSAGIFEAQRLMLRDEALYEAVVEHIRSDAVNAGFAIDAVLRHHRQRMEAGPSEYLRERAADLSDVQNRLIRHLRREHLLANVKPGSIVFAEDLSAADVVLFSRRRLRGFAIDHGGATSHVSIIARALGLPTVAGLGDATDAVRNGDPVVLDGLRGEVVARPSAAHRERYKRQQAEQKDLAGLPSETADGTPFTLSANIEFSQEVRLLDEYGADGIGLFRTEMLLMMSGDVTLSAESTFETYKDVVERTAPQTTTLRLLDLGGDKLLPLAHREENPFLGWRGIRVLLDKPELLKTQLRAILRASAFGPVRILVPMITHMDEVHRVRSALEEVKSELRAEGRRFDDDVPLGIMVEVPAVALRAGTFAEAVDFFSVGTNDLTQYVLATDRGNDLVAREYDEFHPAVLAMIKRAANAAQAADIPISVCGEVAGDARATPLLIGLGIDELSASPTFLPEIKRVVRAVDRSETRALAGSALSMHTADEVTELVNDWMRRRAADIMRFLDPEAEADDLAAEEAFEEEAAAMENDRNSASAQDLTAEDVDADLPEPAGGAEGG
ncbi:MAG: phosphoenolpyruvate--protein phosphotransferase [Bacteroidetes bacterium QS_8_68_15]|nr:MAG: phosphoenolpyruvate--protein phosphotransferase [Bacteroidetes bacterium QS_8_68_15]